MVQPRPSRDGQTRRSAGKHRRPRPGQIQGAGAGRGTGFRRIRWAAKLPDCGLWKGPRTLPIRPCLFGGGPAGLAGCRSSSCSARLRPAQPHSDDEHCPCAWGREPPGGGASWITCSPPRPAHAEPPRTATILVLPHRRGCSRWPAPCSRSYEKGPSRQHHRGIREPRAACRPGIVRAGRGRGGGGKSVGPSGRVSSAFAGGWAGPGWVHRRDHDARFFWWTDALPAGRPGSPGRNAAAVGGNYRGSWFRRARRSFSKVLFLRQRSSPTARPTGRSARIFGHHDLVSFAIGAGDHSSEPWLVPPGKTGKS